MKQYLFLITIFLLVCSCRKETTLFDELKSEDKLEAAYHFTPSTLRMLNFQKDSSINKLVKDVRKLSLFSMKPSAMSVADMKNYIEELKTEKQYELYLEIDSPENQCYILGNSTKEQTVALYGQGEKCYVMDITGTVDFMQLPRVYRTLSEQDSTKASGFSMLFDVMKQDSDREARRREHKRRRAAELKERQAKEKEAEQETVSDSTLLN